MQTPYINKFNIGARFANPIQIADHGYVKENAFSMAGLNKMNNVEGPSFKSVMGSTLKGVNETMQAPEKVMQDAIVNGTADIHDVMIANSKAELTVNITSQFVTKIIQAYDKVLQIQI